MGQVDAKKADTQIIQPVDDLPIERSRAEGTQNFGIKCVHTGTSGLFLGVIVLAIAIKSIVRIS